MSDGQFKIYGMYGSPYSMKMRAVLRYRRIPFVFVPTMGGSGPIADVRPPVIPVVEFPDGSMHVDSTPTIDALEEAVPGQRSIVPDDPGTAYLAELIEDFADEWCTKIMFHYRWDREIDQQTFSREGAFDGMGAAGRQSIESVAEGFRKRQVGRLPLVGCTEENRPVIEDSFDRLVRLLDSHVTEERFLFGNRPSRADFGLYGQLDQLANDPTPSARMREMAPYTWRWVKHLDDLCGHEGEWRAADAPIPDALPALLRMIGEIYLPFLVANTAAFEAGDEDFLVELHGAKFRQGTFKYQVKCHARLRESLARLSGKDRETTYALLDEAGALGALQ